MVFDRTATYYTGSQKFELPPQPATITSMSYNGNEEKIGYDLDEQAYAALFWPSEQMAERSKLYEYIVVPTEDLEGRYEDGSTQSAVYYSAKLGFMTNSLFASQPISIKKYGAQKYDTKIVDAEAPIMEKMTAAEKKKYKK